MKRKHLLLTLLMALAVPLAALAQVERTVTVYNGISTNTHIPVDGSQGVSTSAKNQFIMSRLELGAIKGKPITKMAFHTVAPTPTPNTGNHLPYNVMLAEVDAVRFTSNALIQDSEMSNAVIVATNVSLNVEDNMLVIEFRHPYTFSGTKNLLVEFTCSNGSQWYYSPWYGTCDLMFYGVDEARAGNIDMGFGIYRHYGFVPKTTFTYQDNANWDNTNRPQNLVASADSDGRLNLFWDAPSGYSGGYQTLYSVRPYAPNWDEWSYTPYTADVLTNLTPNTMYDIYVRAYDGDHASDIASAIISTYAIADLDNDTLTLDFDGAFVHNGITATGNAHRQLETTRYFFMEGPESGYSSYMLRYGAGQALTVNLPGLNYTNATNGIIMEFDLYSATDLQVKFWRQGYDTDLGTFSANTRTHYMVRATDGMGAQNAYFQFVTSAPFSIDNIVIRKAANLLPVTDLTASDVTTNSAVISWDDPNVNTHVLELYYRPKGYQNGEPHSWQSYTTVTGTSYTLMGLSTYTDYEVMVKANNGSVYENSGVLSFHTMCPPTATPYTMDFTGLSELPQYWRIKPVYPHEYADVVADPNDASNNVLKVHTGSEVYSVAGYYNYFHYALNGNVVLPYFTGLNALQLDFQGASSNSNYTYNVDVKVASDPSYLTSAQTIESFVLSSDMTDYSVNFSNSQYADGFIVLYVYGSYNPLDEQAALFDNFVVTRAPAPSNLTVNLTNVSATLGWTTAAASVELQYRTAGGTWSQSVTPEGNSYTMTGLTAGTEYEARIRANYGTQNSDWVSFGTFKTLMQEAVTLNASNTSYFEDFESNSGDWLLMNASTNKWRRFSYSSQIYGNQGYGLRVTYSANNTLTPKWEYTTRSSSTINGQTVTLGTPATSYAVKTFALSEGHYVFTYKYAVKGVANEDYMRVVLVPAETEIEAGSLPEGFDYQNTPDGWFSLDRGHQLTGYSANYYHWQQQINITLNVYPGGTYEPGNYMIVVLWHNPGTPGRDGQNPPGAIGDVSVTWSALLTPPDMNTLLVTESDTQTELTWNVPTCALTPTGYEVEYATNNNFNDALTASTETNGIMLTGLTPNTSYFVRIRSAYTANGVTTYSDWSDDRAFTTMYPRPTDLTVVDQTTSWVRLMWTAVQLDLEEGQRLNYSYQLTTDPENWGEVHDGVAGDCNELNLAPGTYYYRLMTKVYDNTYNCIGTSDWSEPIEFTIAPWTDPVTIFPLTYGFEESSSRFVDGITLGGNLGKFDFYSYYNAQDQLPAHDGGESGNLLGFMSGSNGEAYMVLPPLRPSTNDALVSFWWYHDSSNTNPNDGVIVEQSNDGNSWTPFGTLIQRYAAVTGWVKYDMVVPAPTSYDKVYVRLRFYGTNNNEWWKRCYLDDLTVNNFKSYQPYISYVSSNGNAATLTIFDYNYQMGWPSSAFEVQYREYREPGQTQQEWVAYPQFTNNEPAFEKSLTVEGLHPATYYEFRVCAYITYDQFTFPASDYSTIYRQWTDCGTYTITPSYSYTEGFEDLFNGTDCWEIAGDWTMQQSDGHGGNYCAYVPSTATSTSVLTMPEIDFSGCDNVILRFWSKGVGKVQACYGENFATKRLLYAGSNTTDWVQIELTLSYFMDKGPVKIVFEPNVPYHKAWYVDDLEIVANVYDKIFDVGGYSYYGEFTASSLWYPSGTPTAEDEVMIMATARVGMDESSVRNAVVGIVRFGSCGSLMVNTLGTLTATEINATKTFTVKGTANVATLNPGAANSVVVKGGGTLYAGTITGTSLSATDKVIVEDGGQLKTDHEAFATIKKNIDSYTEVEQQNNVERGGYYLVSSPLHSDFINPAQGGMVTYVEEDGEVVWNYDLYAFNYEYEGAEWRNYKDDDFLMEVGRGYLYANRDGVELSFAGRIAANDTPVYIGTSYSQGGTYDFNGWKLVGNPFTCDAYITDVSAPDCMSFYRMNPTGSGFIAATGAIKPMEGVFLRSTMSAQAFGFSRDDNSNIGSKLCFNLNQGNVLVDNAIVRFGEGGTLAKFSFNNNTSKVYFPQKGSNYAVVSSHPVGELPLNFEATKDGTYTLSVNIDEAELLYCHLIDNKTGADVNLLETPEYTFSAKVDDYASRFKVVFVAASEDADGDSETFAFNSNGNWIIANEGRATLQVIDLNGRVLSSQQIEGSAETRINAVPGLYMIRLINGENVKVQKVVVR